MQIKIHPEVLGISQEMQNVQNQSNNERKIIMKKFTILVLSAILLFLTSCSSSTPATSESPKEDIIYTNAAYAVDFVRNNMKNKQSFEVYSVATKRVHPVDHGDGYLYDAYEVYYSATNNFGARVEDTAYLLYWRLNENIGEAELAFTSDSLDDYSSMVKNEYWDESYASSTKLNLSKVMKIFKNISE